MSRDLEGVIQQSTGITLYTAKLEVFASSQSSVFFFSTLFGTKQKPSILDTPWRIKNDSFRGKMPTNALFQHREKMQAVRLHPEAYLNRSGRTVDDLDLKDDHYFNGTHFQLGWEPEVTSKTAAHIRETIEECIILLPKNVGRIHLLCKNDALLLKCVYEAVRDPRASRFLASRTYCQPFRSRFRTVYLNTSDPSTSTSIRSCCQTTSSPILPSSLHSSPPDGPK